MQGIFTKDIAVLDVTSRLISAVVGVKTAQSVFRIKAVSEHEHSGFVNGEWLDLDDTTSAVSAALDGVLSSSKTKTKQLFIGVPSEFIAVVTKRVTITLDRKRRIVDGDISYLLKKGDTFDHGKYLTINSSAVYYSVNTSDKLYADVRGQCAGRIDALVSYILCERRFVVLFDEISSSRGFKEIQYVSSAWAEGLALLENEQRELAYILVDIGYISSSIIVGRGEGVLNLSAFSLGGAHISADIYDALDVPFYLAEQARELVDLNLSYPEGSILVGDKDNTILATDVSEIMKARLDVFGDIIADVLKVYSADMPTNSSVYLTGEGISEIRGVKKYLSEILGKNVEIITPKLPGYVAARESSKISLLSVSETLAKAGFGGIIKHIVHGGKI